MTVTELIAKCSFAAGYWTRETEGTGLGMKLQAPSWTYLDCPPQSPGCYSPVRAVTKSDASLVPTFTRRRALSSLWPKSIVADYLVQFFAGCSPWCALLAQHYSLSFILTGSLTLFPRFLVSIKFTSAPSPHSQMTHAVHFASNPHPSFP